MATPTNTLDMSHMFVNIGYKEYLDVFDCKLMFFYIQLIFYAAARFSKI